MKRARPAKSITAIAATAALALVGVTPATAVEAYHPGKIEQPANMVAVTIDDGIYEAGPSMIEISHVTERWANGSEMWGAFTQCERLTDAPCDPKMLTDKNYSVWANINMPVCENDKHEFCIESVAIYPDGEKANRAEFLGYGSGTTVPANRSVGLPKGTPVSLWRGTAIHTGGTDTYSVRAFGRFEVEKGKFKIKDFNAVVFPYVEEFDESENGMFWWDREDGTRTTQGANPGLAFRSQGVRGITHDFDLDTRVRLQMRVPTDIKGWLKGRATEPNFSSTKFSNTANRWVLDAKPVIVPKLRVLATDAQRSKKMRDFPMWSDGRAESWNNLGTSSEGGDAFNWIKDLRRLAKDTASAQAVVWQLSATDWGTGACDARANGISGFVLTNAMAYSGNAPRYRRGFLDYEVAGMHKLPDGEEALGTYDLVMNSAVARCLYGFSNAPVSATITISGEGDKNIATTVVGERNGWLRLAAYGFTFSQKTIKVKLTQKRQTTITCVAPGKKSVKVTAANPKCPKGFKKR